MTTLRTPFEAGPLDLGLPEEQELASWASALWNEGSADAATQTGGAPTLGPSRPRVNAPSEVPLFPQELPQAASWPTESSAESGAADTASRAYSPRVLPAGAPASGGAPGGEAGVQESARAKTPVHYVGNQTLDAIRADFPVLSERVNGGTMPLVWLDNAATTQKPRAVIDRLSYYYEHENSNVHRGDHEMAARATDAYEAAREKTACFLGAPSEKNIVFVRGTTEAINLVAQAFVRPRLWPGDEIITTFLEHHANIVPWQLIAEETGAVLRAAPVDDQGRLLVKEFAKLFNRRTKFAAFAQVSNALGTILPVEELIHIAHAAGVPVLVDGAQSTPHIPTNVTQLDADFFVFSGHKIFGPTGIGALYGKTEVLEAARPWQGGGSMIADVTFERTIYNGPPEKFEAGTPNIADAVGLGAALDYVSALGMPALAAWEHELLRYGMSELRTIPGLRLLGPESPTERASVLSFVIEGRSFMEVGQHLSSRGIAVRAGHHCAQPIYRRFGLEGSVRPSLAFYNTPEEIDALVRALREIT